ncbi:hypothetical protein N599_04050 [Saccharopolyspora erythraea D]|nr:hypothetical protein N599_04050 [Saccharopolyspora erythraea D]
MYYTGTMATLNVRTDQAKETALKALAGEHRTRSEAVRYALLRTYRELLLEQAEVTNNRATATP